MRRCLPHLIFAGAMSLSLPAFAQNANCPPGSWFCADTKFAIPGPNGAPAPAAQPAEPAALPAQPAQPAAPARHAAPPAQLEDGPEGEPAAPARQPRGEYGGPPGYGPSGYGPPPPVVVYQGGPPPPAHVVIMSPGYMPMHRLPPSAAPPRLFWSPEWGVNLHVEGLAFGGGNGAAQNAAMGGIGGSLRYRPVPHFAIEGGVDLIAGNDYNGFERTEIPVSLMGILYVNPRSRVQFYLTGGMALSHADVRSDQPSPLLHRNSDGFGASYSYFGGQGGAGLEFRLSKHVALDLDGLGFIRKRTDDNSKPEFINERTGQTTNTSAGAIFRGGVTFLW